MTHNSGDHTPATHFLLTGEPPPRDTDQRAQWPHLGAVLSAVGRGRGPLPPFVSMRPKLPNDVPRFVEQSQGQFGGWLGPLHDPLTIDADPSLPDYRVGELTLQPEISVSRLESRRELLANLDRRLDGFSPQFAAFDQNHRRAFELLTSAGTERGAFKLEEEPRVVRERYGLNPHGQSVLQARRPARGTRCPLGDRVLAQRRDQECERVLGYPQSEFCGPENPFDAGGGPGVRRVVG